MPRRLKMSKIYAGLDHELEPRLYWIVCVNDEERLIELTQSDWIRILDKLGAEFGEFLCVDLKRDGEHHE